MISFEFPAKEGHSLGSEDSALQGSMVCHLWMVGGMQLGSKLSLPDDGLRSVSGQPVTLHAIILTYL